MSKPTRIITVADLQQDQQHPGPWKARRKMSRVTGKAARARGWERRPDTVGRPGQGLVPYVPDDPRVDPEACTHCQIKDLFGAPGPVSRCLDCGALIETAARVLLLEVPEEYADEPDDVDDTTLDTLRQEWNNAQWGAP